MEAAIEQIKKLAETADDKMRRQLVDGVRDLLYTVERPEDLAQRLMFGQFQLSVARLAQNSKLVQVLVQNEDKPIPVGDVAAQSDMSPLLTERLLRYMTAFGMLRQVSENDFAANKNTRALNDPMLRAGLGFGSDIISPSAQALPEWLRKNNYKVPDSIQNCPWYPEHNPQLNAMQFIHSNPSVLAEFNTYMTHRRLDSPSWFDKYAVDLQAPEPVFFIDIGGGVGHQSIALKQRYPEIKGRIIVQDVAATIDKLANNAVFEPMAYDYHTEQPVKGARYYYLRNILHNLTDEGCKTVLSHTKKALGSGSKILVDEIIVPVQGAHWRTVQLDMLMMSALGAIERTEKHWHELVASVGLKIASQHVYDPVSRDAILELVPDV